MVVEEKLPQGSQEAPMLVITANKAEDLEELGPAAVKYISQMEGLLDTSPEQWAKAWVTAAKEQQAQEGAAAVQGLAEEVVQAAQEEQGMEQEGQEGQVKGHKGGKAKGHNWYELTEQEMEEGQEETPLVTAAKAAAKAAAKEAATSAALASIAAFGKAKKKAKEEEDVVQEGRAGSSQDHRVQQGRKEVEEQQGQEEEEGTRVSKAKEVQAGLLAKLTQWWSGCP